jgi:phosphatidylserine decarboxylase
MFSLPHQYIERNSGRVLTETLFADRVVKHLYHGVRENAPALFMLLTSSRMSEILAFINFDIPFKRDVSGRDDFLKASGVDLSECVLTREELNTPRKVFERQIRYWDCRPMPEDKSLVVSPADARLLVGSLKESSDFFIKDKFFTFSELLGGDSTELLNAFSDGEFAIFRLTPDKYHYNHNPVSGVVIDIYELDGSHHSCNPGAVVAETTPYSKNSRVVTIIDTDISGGTGVGLVAMIEVVALMIGEIVQCYSETGYSSPQQVKPGMFLMRGQPKSLYRPGSSTDILLFQPGRVRFSEDLLNNRVRKDVSSRFSIGFGAQMVETDVKVRSSIASPCSAASVFYQQEHL